MSVHTRTAGHLPLPSGWKSAESETPLAMGTLTSVSTTLASPTAAGARSATAVAAAPKPKARRETVGSWVSPW